MPRKSMKPLEQLQKLTHLLGWPWPVRLWQHLVKENGAPADLRGKTLTWYEVRTVAGDRNEFFLQINELPQGQTVTYTACVYADRYRLCSGWHKFRLFSNDDDLKREARRLAKWLAWEWFGDPDKRRAFRQAHPECVTTTSRLYRQALRQQDVPILQSSRKPLKRLQRVARLLGWQSPLHLYQRRPDGIPVPPGMRGRLITWYMAGTSTGGRNDCFLHIRELPLGQTVAHDASVYAPRYRLSTGFHKFRLFRSEEDLQREVARLAPWLAWDWFASLEKRRAFRQAHPECVM